MLHDTGALALAAPDAPRSTTLALRDHEVSCAASTSSFASGAGAGTTIVGSFAFGGDEFGAQYPMDEMSLKYSVKGPGVQEATVRQPTRFWVAAVDSSTGNDVPTAGMGFMVTIRGVTRAHARAVQTDDGLYTVEWKPSMSGPYTITISKRGQSLPGSPFLLIAATPMPHPSHCLVRGKGLNDAIARKKQDFEIAFKDKLGCTTSAVELDVFVETAIKVVADADEPKMDGAIVAVGAAPAAEAAPAGSDAAPGSPEFDAAGRRFETRRRTIRVKVGEKALVVRARFEIDSEVLGQLLPGSTITVIEERISPGYVRACVNLDETDKKVDDPQSTSGVAFRSGSEATFRVFAPVDEATAAKVSSPTLTNRTKPSKASRSTLTVEPILEEPIPKAPALASTEVEKTAPAPTPAILALFNPRPSDAAPAAAPASPEKKLRTGASKRKPGLKLKLEEVVSATAEAATAAGRGGNAQQPAPSQRVSQRELNRPSQRSHRASDAPTKSHRPTARTAQQKAKAKTGWVTLVKNGNKLVSSRLRLDVMTRQQHSQQWTRRLENEKHGVRKDGKAPRSVTGPSLTRPLAMELAVDGTGFAYGGLFPGTLHSHGALREFHTVSYSIGVAGSYLLHVRLRNQAAALPGSPFPLQVLPGPAWAQSSSLPFEQLTSEVGETFTHLMRTADKIGNACVVGGAEVTNERSQHLEVACEDMQDGTYLLKWTSEQPGEFVIQVKVAGQHVINSPSKIRFVSTVPEIEFTDVSGDGLTHAVVGEQSTILVQLRDRFKNEAVPRPAFREAFRINMSFIKSSMTGQQGENEAHDDVELAWLSDTSGDVEVRYRPQKENQGYSELHLFCCLPGDDKRQHLPGSPFQLAVSSNVNENVSTETDTTGAAPRDYRVVRSVFDEAQEMWGLVSIDAFASEPTTLVARFWTAQKCDNAEATDAMKQRWSRGERIWAHPPPDMLPRLAQLLKSPNRLSEVFVCAPYWPSTPWFRDVDALATNKKKYPAGSLKKVMKDDAPARCESWPIILFRVPAPAPRPDEDDAPLEAPPAPAPAPAALPAPAAASPAPETSLEAGRPPPVEIPQLTMTSIDID